MRRRMLMDLMSRGDGVIKYGYFDVTNPQYPEAENYQVPETDYKIEIETDLLGVPSRIVCLYVDAKETYSNGIGIFYGNSVLNGGYDSARKVNDTEAISFLNPGTYLNFDVITKEITLHVMQWRVIKCGKWMWIAIYDE